MKSFYKYLPMVLIASGLIFGTNNIQLVRSFLGPRA